ncbi:MAG: IclR family transcriptional regulator [Hyphomicrobiaceae bacterium]
MTRAVAILRLLGRSPEPIGVNQVARELGLVPSTCLHILRVLVDEGLVAFDNETRRYTIDIGIIAIARDAIQRNTFASLIEPRLTELSRQFGGTAIATHLVDSDHMVVVALSRARQPFRLEVDLGSRFPALISATGRCHAAFNLVALPSAQLKARFARLKWDHAPDYADWRRDVADARANGFAIDRGLYISGVTIIAVPFLDAAGHMTHSLVSIDISERIDAIGREAIIAAMLEIRDEVAELMIDGMHA